MKKLCVIILPAFLSVVLTSCAWLYQVTGVESCVSAGGETECIPATSKAPEEEAADTEISTALREGCYSNGSYIMELIGVDNTQGSGYQLVVCTPQYGTRMFIGSVQKVDVYTESFTVSDNDNSDVTLAVDVSGDGQTLLVTFCEDGTENTSISGTYMYSEQQDDAVTEVLYAGAAIAEGEYSCKGYRLIIVYEDDHIRVEIAGPLGNTLLNAAQEVQVPVQSVVFEGDFGNTMIVASGDGSGNVVVSGRGDSDQTLQYAGIYTVS